MILTRAVLLLSSACCYFRINGRSIFGCAFSPVLLHHSGINRNTYSRVYTSLLHNSVLFQSQKNNDVATDTIVERHFSGENLPPLLRELNPSQIDAVTQPLQGMTRVIAGPGSGKTRVLTSRIAYLLEHSYQYGPYGDRILAVTFTRKAAGEMQSRVTKQMLETHKITDDKVLLPPELDRVTLGTFHSVCARILRWHGDWLGDLPSVREVLGTSRSRNNDDDDGDRSALRGTFSIADQSEQVRIVNNICKERNIDLKNVRVFDIISAISKMRDAEANGINLFVNKDGKPAQVGTSLEIAGKVYQNYKYVLLSSNQVDYDDLIYLTRELLIQHSEIRESLQRRWTHILVDEFQDTSQSQMDLVKMWTSSSLMVVGDADQSIYSWRGAHSGSLAEFADMFKDYPGGVKTVYLMENYRSTSRIISAAQKVISESQTKSDALRRDMKPRREAGASPRIVACADEIAEAKFVVNTIHESIKSGDITPKSSVALIYRTNAQSRNLEEECVKQNLPYVIFGSATSFYKRQEVKDTLCFLRFLNNGFESASMLRAFQTPARGLGPKAIEEFDEFCQQTQAFYRIERRQDPLPSPLDILIAMADPDNPRLCHDAPHPADTLSTRPLKLFREFAAQMKEIRDMAYKEPLEAVLTHIIDTFDLLQHFDKISKSDMECEERIQNVRELQQATQRLTEAGPCLGDTKDDFGATATPLASFLDDVALITDMADASRDFKDDRFVVSLMTIHASKGMEFDTVFLVGAEDKTLPGRLAIDAGVGSVKFEEERRLCYVAMTRAKTSLIITWRKNAPFFFPDGVRREARERSCFLDVLVSGKAKSSKEKTSRQSLLTNAYTNDKAVTRKWSNRSSNYAAAVPRTNQWTRRSSPKEATSGPPAISRRRVDVFDKSFLTNNNDSIVNGSSASASSSTNSRTTVTSPNTRKVYTPSKNRSTTTTTLPPSSPAKVNKQSADSTVSEEFRLVQVPKADSTCFYAVGSYVQHSYYGRGSVLEPPPPVTKLDGRKELMVRVRFENDQEIDFPALTDKLLPTF